MTKVRIVANGADISKAWFLLEILARIWMRVESRHHQQVIPFAAGVRWNKYLVLHARWPTFHAEITA